MLASLFSLLRTHDDVSGVYRGRNPAITIWFDAVLLSIAAAIHTRSGRIEYSSFELFRPNQI